MRDSIRILLISGSLRSPSYTRTLTQSVEKVLARHGAKTTHWSLRETPLPSADPEFHHDPSRHPEMKVRSLVALADSCEAFVLSSPIYHNSYSGILKNALDHLAISQFYYKPIGVLSHGGDRSTQAADHLRIVARGLLGIAIPTHVCTAQQDYAEMNTGGYELVSQDILQRIERFALELMAFAYQLRAMRQASKDS